MEPSDVTRARLVAVEVARRHPGLELLLLHGSRARGDARASSDWDFAYLADEELDASLVYADLAAGLGTDDVRDLRAFMTAIRDRLP